MSLSDFIQSYGGRRVDGYAPQPPLEGEPTDDAEEPEDADGLDYEFPRDEWDAVDPDLPDGWRPDRWDERPIRFVDGKDVGETVAWLRAPRGYPVPVRLSQIGGVVVRLENGECRREFVVVDKVVSMVADLFPWEEVESFAADLHENGFRLLTAEPPGKSPSYDFEKMRKAAQNRSEDEMGVLEEAALAQDSGVPTIVDGRLEPRSGGFDNTQPVFGVVKKHHKNYLHPRGMQLLYLLEPGQRTPVFKITKSRKIDEATGDTRQVPVKLPVISWYVRLDGGAGTLPNWGLIRVEATWEWFKRCGEDRSAIDQLSRTLCEYRCREASYSRAPVSLHPIVRAEESLGSLFHPGSLLTHRFYRLADL